MQRPGADPATHTIGLWVASEGNAVRGALVGSQGRGFRRRAEIAAEAAVELDADLCRMIRELTGGLGTPADASSLAAQLAGPQAALVGELLAAARLPREQVLAVGVHDPGVWSEAAAGRPAWRGLCDAARLAEATGLNVLDAFPARDLAAGGIGGPITALPEWLLLKSQERTRLLLVLGQAARLTLLPAEGPAAHSRVLSLHVGPGLRLLDALTQRLTGGTQRMDQGGRLAVQGRHIPSLLDLWLSEAALSGPLPRWHPAGMALERLIEPALRQAVAQGWSVADLLATATHLVAATIARALAVDLPAEPKVEELIVAGGGRHNGSLLRQIRDRLPEFSWLACSSLGVSAEALAPASVALLAALWLDQTPASQPAVSGVDVPRVLGRLTPGSPRHLRRLCEHLGAAAPNVAPLSSAW